MGRVTSIYPDTRRVIDAIENSARKAAEDSATCALIITIKGNGGISVLTDREYPQREVFGWMGEAFGSMLADRIIGGLEGCE